ncbi:hypothetical protein NE664_10550 [Anaerotignum faecicola]|nr:hypothetical protein [Anaerotignum faecicola]
MEYKLQDGGEWTPCTDEPMYFDIPDTLTVTYLVRYKASGSGSESKATALDMYGHDMQPNVSASYMTEETKSITDKMEYSINDEPYKDVTKEMIEGSMSSLIDELTESSAKLNIRYKATDKKPSSHVYTTTFYPRRDVPSGFGIDTKKVELIGLNSDMKYLLPNSDWKTASTSSVKLDEYASENEEVTIYIRNKYIRGEYSASKPVAINLPKLRPNSTTLKLNYLTEQIEGFKTGVSYEYRKLTTGSWKAVPENNGSIPANFSGNPSVSKDISIYFRETGSSTQMPTSQITFILSKRPSAPSVKFVYNNPSYPEKAVLTGLEGKSEYKLNSDTQWKDVPDGDFVFDIPSVSAKYDFRLKATETSFASSICSETLKKQASPSGISYNTTTEILSFSFEAYKYEFINSKGEWEKFDSDAKEISLSALVDSVPSNGATEYSVRKAATDSSAASLPRVIVLYPRLVMTSTPTFDTSTKVLSNVTKEMQYRVPGVTSWRSISKTTVDLSSLIEGKPNPVVEVRMKPTATNSASKTITINCF